MPSATAAVKANQDKKRKKDEIQKPAQLLSEKAKEDEKKQEANYDINWFKSEASKLLDLLIREVGVVDEKDPRLAKCEKLIKRDIEDMEVLYNYKNPAIAKSDIVKSGYYRLCRLSSNMSKIMYNQVEEQEA